MICIIHSYVGIYNYAHKFKEVWFLLRQSHNYHLNEWQDKQLSKTVINYHI